MTTPPPDRWKKADPRITPKPSPLPPSPAALPPAQPQTGTTSRNTPPAADTPLRPTHEAPARTHSASAAPSPTPPTADAPSWATSARVTPSSQSLPPSSRTAQPGPPRPQSQHSQPQTGSILSTIDPDRLTTLVCGGIAVLLLVSFFLPWNTLSMTVLGIPEKDLGSMNGFGNFTSNKELSRAIGETVSHTNVLALLLNLLVLAALAAGAAMRFMPDFARFSGCPIIISGVLTVLSATMAFTRGLDDLIGYDELSEDDSLRGALSTDASIGPWFALILGLCLLGYGLWITGTARKLLAMVQKPAR